MSHNEHRPAFPGGLAGSEKQACREPEGGGSGSASRRPTSCEPTSAPRRQPVRKHTPTRTLSPAAPERAAEGALSMLGGEGGCFQSGLGVSVRPLGAAPAAGCARRPRPTPPPAARPRRGRAACSSRRSSLAAAPRGSLPGCGRDGGGGRTQSRAARTGDLRLALPAPRPLGGTWIISVIP